jgi:hypothetical protein
MEERKMRILDAAAKHTADRRSISRLLGTFGLVVGVLVSAGCKVERTELDLPTVDASTEDATTPAGDTSSTPAATTPSSPTATTPAAPAVEGADALDLSTVDDWFLPSLPGVSSGELIGARVTATIRSASTNGDTLYTSYDPYDFPSSDGTDAVCYFFYVRDGKVVGGKFDWWRSGGQGTKSLENVHDGYGGHSMPSSGTECWTMFSSKDGSQRSNTCLVTWK